VHIVETRKMLQPPWLLSITRSQITQSLVSLGSTERAAQPQACWLTERFAHPNSLAFRFGGAKFVRR